MVGLALIVFTDYRESADLADLLNFLLKNKISPIITTPDKFKDTFKDVKNNLKNSRVPILFYKNAHTRIDLPTQILGKLWSSTEFDSVVNSNNELAAFSIAQIELKDNFNLNDPFVISKPFKTNVRIQKNTEGYLVYDGERVVPEAPAAYENMLQHLSYYNLFIPYTTRAIVADIACGCGYGTFEVAKHAKEVIGFDIDNRAVHYASSHYKKENLKYQVGISSDMPKNYFDVVLSVETFEHIELEDIHGFIKDIHTALKPKGSWFFTTHNGDKLVYNPKTKAERRGQHVKHYTQKELEEMLSCFQIVQFVQKTDYDYAVRCRKL